MNESIRNIRRIFNDRDFIKELRREFYDLRFPDNHREVEGHKLGIIQVDVNGTSYYYCFEHFLNNKIGLQIDEALIESRIGKKILTDALKKLIDQQRPILLEEMDGYVTDVKIEAYKIVVDFIKEKIRELLGASKNHENVNFLLKPVYDKPHKKEEIKQIVTQLATSGLFIELSDVDRFMDILSLEDISSIEPITTKKYIVDFLAIWDSFISKIVITSKYSQIEESEKILLSNKKIMKASSIYQARSRSSSKHKDEISKIISEFF
jgi:hypothetical protein